MQKLNSLDLLGLNTAAPERHNSWLVLSLHAGLQGPPVICPLLQSESITSSLMSCVTRHAFGDQYRATDLVIPGSGKVELVYTPEGGGPPERHTVHDFDGAGVVMGMYNTEASIRGFAKACFEYALDRQWCVHRPIIILP